MLKFRGCASSNLKGPSLLLLQNFKEAAKLSAEVKALTAEADAAEEAAKRAREELQMLSQQAHGSSQLEAALEAQAAAEREHALARCRRLQVCCKAWIPANIWLLGQVQMDWTECNAQLHHIPVASWPCLKAVKRLTLWQARCWSTSACSCWPAM